MILFAQIALVAIAVFCLAYVVAHIRAGFKTRLVLFALLAIGLACGCGPVNGKPKSPSFVVVVHNDDLLYPETMNLSWWNASTIAGVQTATIPGGGSHVFFVGFMPDGFELDSTAYPAQSGGQVWQTPEYAGFYVFHVHYPTGVTWGEYPVR